MQFTRYVLAGVVVTLGLVSNLFAGTEFDGTYSGTMTLVRDNSGKNRCPKDAPMTVTVKDGRFATSWRRQPGEVTLSPDGTFKTTVAGADVSGKVVSGALETDMSDGICAYKWSLKRQ